jgi:hypothetical protein
MRHGPIPLGWLVWGLMLTILGDLNDFLKNTVIFSVHLSTIFILKNQESHPTLVSQASKLKRKYHAITSGKHHDDKKFPARTRKLPFKVRFNMESQKPDEQGPIL